MLDYELTAGQQQLIIDFLNAGKSVYVEGNDFGYFHKNDPLYSMFGCSYVGDHDLVDTLDGADDTIMEGAALKYKKNGFADDYMDWFIATDGDLSLKANKKWRMVSYAGPNGKYRSMHAAFWFGALINSAGSHTKADMMAAYMRYLKGESLVLGIENTISASRQSDADLFLEATDAQGGRNYFILSSLSGTSPGTPIGSMMLPINFDLFSSFAFTLMNTPAMSKFSGTLNSTGRGMATLNTLGSVGSGAVGLKMYFAYLLTAPKNYVSDPVMIEIIN